MSNYLENDYFNFPSTHELASWSRENGYSHLNEKDLQQYFDENIIRLAEDSDSQNNWRHSQQKYGAYIPGTKYHIHVSKLTLLLLLEIISICTINPSLHLPAIGCLTIISLTTNRLSFISKIENHEFCVYIAAYSRFLQQPFTCEEMIRDRERDFCDTRTQKWRCPFRHGEDERQCAITKENIEKAIETLENKECLIYANGKYHLSF